MNQQQSTPQLALQQSVPLVKEVRRFPREDLIVSKFGGTSLKDAQAILRSASLVARDPSNCLVVVSATAGTTDQLTELATVAIQEIKAAKKIIESIGNRHYQIIEELEQNSVVANSGADSRVSIKSILLEVQNLCQGIFYLQDCSEKTQDQLLAAGERLSAQIFALALGTITSDSVEVVDARQLIKTDQRFGQAAPLYDEVSRRTKLILEKRLEQGKQRIVTQGFIGSTAQGATTTLGRGGSDFSAAILAEALQASRLKVFTDVAGIATTDPRLVPHAKFINSISFDEAAELSVFGAKVLHPSTLVPAIRSNIPVEVNSSIEHGHRGTLIETSVENPPLVRAISLKSNQSILTISNPKMLEAWGFLSRIFAVFAKHRVSVDLVTTSEISIAINLNDSDIQNKALIQELETLGDIDIEIGLAIIALVGNSITHTSGLARYLFTELEDINIRMICMGASSHNVCFLVDEEVAPEVVRRLHRVFLENKPTGEDFACA